MLFIWLHIMLTLPQPIEDRVCELTLQWYLYVWYLEFAFYSVLVNFNFENGLEDRMWMYYNVSLLGYCNWIFDYKFFCILEPLINMFIGG